MIAAPVGFQCPSCVQAAAPPQPRTVAGGAIISKPFVTYTLIGINVAFFAIQLVAGVNNVASILGMSPVAIASNDEWWRLLTGAFLHGSFIHIAFNMLVLFVLGRVLEEILGHSRFLTLYVLSALGGAVTSYIFSRPGDVSIGASGAVFGLMGALVVAGQRLRYDIRLVLILLGINIVIGFIRPNIDWRAHLGGLIVGALVAAIMVLPKRQHRKLVQATGLVSVALALAAMAAWRTQDLIQTYGPVIVLN